MKDIILLIKQRKSFYLITLIITVFITVSGALYNISLSSRNYFYDKVMDKVTVEDVENALEMNAEIFVSGADSGALMTDFVANNTYMGYLGVVLLAFTIIVISCFGMYEQRTREFLETLPVKKVALDMYNYVALMGIFLINAVVALVISIISLTVQNTELVQLAERFPQLLEAIVPGNMVMAANLALLQQWGMAMLYLIAVITFIYMITVLFKQQIMGAVLGLLLWSGMSDVVYNLRTWIAGSHVYHSVDNLGALVHPELFFNNYVRVQGALQNSATIKVIVLLGLIIVVALAVMIIHGYIRELSKGKIFYVECLNIALLIMGGIWLYNAVYRGFDRVAACVVTFIAEAVAIYLLYHKKNKVYKLEVKERLKIKNPAFRMGIRSHLIAIGIITVVLLYWDLADLRGTYLYMSDLIIRGYSKEQLAWGIGVFEIYARYYPAMAVVVGLIIFKCIKYMAERNSATREFFETLPMSRMRVFLTKVLMDLCVAAVPLTIFTLVNVRYVFLYDRLLDINVASAVGTQFLLLAVMMCIVVAVLGFMYLIDAVTVGGGLKILYLATAVICIWFFVVLGAEIAGMDWLLELVGLFVGNINTVNVFCYLLAGIVLLGVSGYLYIKRDISKAYFCYAPAKYIFVLSICGIYLMLVGISAWSNNSVFQYGLTIVGTVLCYFFVLDFCTPTEESVIKRKLMKKKNKV